MCRILCSRDAGFADVHIDESVDVYADASDFGHSRNFAKCGEFTKSMYANCTTRGNVFIPESSADI